MTPYQTFISKSGVVGSAMVGASNRNVGTVPHERPGMVALKMDPGVWLSGLRRLWHQNSGTFEPTSPKIR